MTSIPTIDKVKKYFPFIHIAWIRTFWVLIFCVIHKGTVNLNKCKKAMPLALEEPTLSLDAAYKRLIRFFDMQHIFRFCLCIGHLILSILHDTEEIHYLLLDRTTWRIGVQNKKYANLLTLGFLLPNGYFAPLIWEALNKKGNSHQKERIDLLDLFVRYFLPYLPKQKEKKSLVLLADREFIGKTWFMHLSKQFDFVIRCRKDDYLAAVAASREITVNKLAKKIDAWCKRDGFFYTTIELEGVEYQYLVLPNKKKNAKDKYVRFISTLTDIEQISDAYYKRWKIEVFFKHCKTSGFGLEDMNLNKDKKVMLMMAVASFAYVLALKQGCIEHKKKNIKKQYFKNQDKTYFRKSIFTLGYESLEVQIFNLKMLIQIFQTFLHKPLILKYLFIEKT